MNTNPVRYHLRATVLPASPSAVDEVLFRFVREARIDEVMFFLPHLEENSPGLGTVEEVEAAAARVAPLFPKLREMGVAPSVNVWWTVAFSDFPGARRDQADRFDFRWAVNADGKQSRAVACPQDYAWRGHVRWMYAKFAELQPARIWIDDDVRMTMRADMHCPCFCDVCLEEMARRTGQALGRQELLKAILADPPNPVRNAWLDYQNDLMLGIVRDIEGAVHEVSPNTHVSIMHSHFEIHAPEGRRWRDLVEALGTPVPWFRPGIGPYVDAGGMGILEAAHSTRQTMAVLPENVPIAPEIENYPQSRFAKSMATVRADLAIAQLLGLPEMTFSIIRMSERLDLELRHDNAWAPLLRETKPYLQQIAGLNIGRDQFRGISLLLHEEVSRCVFGAQEQTRPIFLYRLRPWDTALPMLGFATRYGLGGVTALAGEQILCMSDAELREALRGGLLLDARAAEALLRAGKGELIGITERLTDAPGVTEVITDAAFGGVAGEIINLRCEGAPHQFAWRDGARVISRVRDYAMRDVGHGVVLFENAGGGRAAVAPFDSQQHLVSLGLAVNPISSATFINWPRQAQLLDLLTWLGRGPVPLFVPEAAGVLPLLIDQGHRLIVGVTNVSYDPIDNLQLRLAAPANPVTRVRSLRQDAQWETLKADVTRNGDSLHIATGLRVDFLETAVLVLE
jgi:hypothetical protein